MPDALYDSVRRVVHPALGVSLASVVGPVPANLDALDGWDIVVERLANFGDVDGEVSWVNALLVPPRCSCWPPKWPR